VFSAANLQNPINGLAIAASLKPFFTSSRYRTQAQELAVLLLGGLTAVDMFKDLFNSALGEPSWQTLPKLAQVARELTSTFIQADDLLNTINQQEQDSKTHQMPPRLVRRSAPDHAPPTKEDISHDRESLLVEITFVCDKIGQVLRTVKPREFKTDLSGIFFFRCNLSAADLTGADLTGATFEGTNLQGAILAQVEKFSDSGWATVRWWEAKVISAPLLGHLRQNFYPYYFKGESFADGKAEVTKDIYFTSLTSLCGAIKMECPMESMKFGEP
jgi:hypothetical protein